MGRLHSGWLLLSQIVTGGVLVVLSVAALGRYTETAGEIARVTGPITPEVKEVDLGGKLIYDIPWRFTQGGCDPTYVTTYRSLNPVDVRDSRYETRDPGPLRPIGQPGIQHIEEPLPPVISPGRWHYERMLTSVCPGGKQPPDTVLAAFDFTVVDRNTPVLQQLKPTHLLTRAIRPGDPLKFVMDYHRLEACPGVATIRFDRINSDDYESIIETRPMTVQTPNVYKDVDITRTVPAEVQEKGGTWHFSANVKSDCNGRIRFDQVAAFDFEVVK